MCVSVYEYASLTECACGNSRGGGGKGEITRLRVYTLLSPKFGLHSVAKLILVLPPPRENVRLSFFIQDVKIPVK